MSIKGSTLLLHPIYKVPSIRFICMCKGRHTMDGHYIHLINPGEPRTGSTLRQDLIQSGSILLSSLVEVMLGCCTAQRVVQWSLLAKDFTKDEHPMYGCCYSPAVSGMSEQFSLVCMYNQQHASAARHLGFSLRSNLTSSFTIPVRFINMHV